MQTINITPMHEKIPLSISAPALHMLIAKIRGRLGQKVHNISVTQGRVERILGL